MMNMRKLFFAVAAVAATASMALAGGDLTKDQAHIYINAGHGSWGSNDRNMATINHHTGDTTGFYESNTNLWKALKMGATLEKWGVPTANIMYSRVKNGPYPTVVGGPDEEKYNRNLTEIAEECNAFNTDYFLSIHSDAATEGSATNLSLLIYNGYTVPAADDENMWEGSRSLEYQLTSRAMAETLWPILESNGIDVLSSTSPRIVGDLTFYYHLNTPADNVNGYAGYLGVLRRNTCNGFLAEGYCHTYQPARHRALNPDYCGQEGVRYARGVAAWFNWETEPTGYIMGSVKDLHKVFSHDLYHPNTNSMDIWKPINFAVVSLYKGGEKIAEYTTDGEYNGVFVFENLEPGDDYTIDAVAPGYKSAWELNEEYGRENVTYSVAANETTYPIIQLEAEGYEANPTYNYPDPFQEKWLKLASSYDMRQDFVQKPVDALAGMTIRREIAKGDSTYVLALDEAKKPHIFCLDACTQTKLFEVSTEGIGNADDENELLAISDIAFTSDSILVACNQVKATFEPTGVLRFYTWTRDDVTRQPIGDPKPWFTSSSNYTSGNFNNAITGTTFAVNGRYEKCIIATTAETQGSSGEIRIPVFTLSRKGLVNTIRNQDKTRFTKALLGESYQLTTSPYGDNNFVIDGNLTTPQEFAIAADVTAPAYGSQLDAEVMPAALNGYTFFKYAKRILVVVPTAEGVALYDVTDGLDAAKLIPTTNTSVSSADAAWLKAYAVVNEADINLYLDADGKVTRFTTEGVEQVLYENVYAYDLKFEESDGCHVFSFLANDFCLDGGRIIFSDAATGEFVGDIVLDHVTAGINEVVVSPDELPGAENQQLRWAVEVANHNVTTFRNLLPREGDYALNRAYVTTDVNPASPQFGWVFVSNYNGSGKAENGIYYFNPTLDRINSTPLANGAFNTNGCLGISPDGFLFVTDAADAAAGLWRSTSNTEFNSFTQFFEGTAASGIITNAGAEVAGVASSVAFTGEGASLKMFALMKNSSKKYQINVYNLGEVNAEMIPAGWGVAPSKTIALPSGMVADAQLAPVEQGVWVCANISKQTNSETAPSLLFVDYDGNITFNSGRLENEALLEGANGSGFAVTRDGKTLAVNDGWGYFQFYDVAFEGNVPTLTPLFSFKHDIGVGPKRIQDGDYVEQMAFTYGGALLASGHYLGMFTVPTLDNRSVTPATTTVVSKGSGVEGVAIDDDANAPVEYFNLQGIRVQNPEKGIYIKRQGRRAEKVVIP